MDMATIIVAVLLIGAALVLAILRIREQNRLRVATRNLIESYSEFDGVLDKIEKLVLNVERKRAAPYIKVYVPSPAHKFYISEVRKLNRLCKYHGLSGTSSFRYALAIQENAMSEQEWKSEDETEYEPSPAWHCVALPH